MPAMAVINTVDCINVTIAQRLCSRRIPASASSYFSSLEISWISWTGKRRRLADCTTQKMSHQQQGAHTPMVRLQTTVSQFQRALKGGATKSLWTFVNAHTRV